MTAVRSVTLRTYEVPTRVGHLYRTEVHTEAGMAVDRPFETREERIAYIKGVRDAAEELGLAVTIQTRPTGGVVSSRRG